MAVLSEIRKRPWILIGILALGLLAFVVDPQSLEKYFGRDPNILGKVNGDKITREELDDQIFLLQQQSGEQSRDVLEEQAWEALVQSKLVKQQFDKMGLEMTEDLFWNQIQFDPMFAQNPQLFDEKGNFKVQELKKEVETMKSQNPAGYADWMKIRKGIEYRIMTRLFLGNVTSAITASDLEATEFIKEKNEKAKIDYVKIDYLTYGSKNKINVTTKDLENYIKEYPTRFKTKASRNIGLVLFSADPSAEDLAAAKEGINQLKDVGMDLGNGIESFQQTQNDSLFIEINSDAPYDGRYLPLSQQPEEIRDFLKTANIGQTYGPFEVDNRYLVVSKLIGKQTRDSVQTRHILIAYEGLPSAQGQQITRSKDEAKKLADSLSTVIQNNPAKFDEFLSYSADTGSANQGGEVGWVTPDSPMVPQFLDFVMSHPKGSTGVAESMYGYHIINIQDRKVGSQGYKVANLVKRIEVSDKTNTTLYTQANQFIQDVHGKSFNDFKNLAQKKNYHFENPRMATRFQGRIQGINTDKDSEVLAWAFDKGTKKGDTNIFTTADGDYIVAYLEGSQEEGLINPESIRDQLEPVVLNKLLAEKIINQINSKKLTSLDQIAKEFGATKTSGEINILTPILGGSMEPKVAGAAIAIKNKTLSQPIEGGTGVYVLVKNSVEKEKSEDDVKSTVEMIKRQDVQVYGQQLLQSLQVNADIKDYRNEAYKKLGINN